MNDWRLLKLETHDAYTNMAIDEAILAARISNRVPNTVRFYCWKPSAVSIGRFQDVEKEVYIETCRKRGVDIVRRMTGGGTVYHDSEGEITYSVVIRRQDLKTSDINLMYAEIYAGLVEALAILGVTADYNHGNQKTCPNLAVRGKKISGSAQAHRGGVILQHGTLLLDADLQKMFTMLRVPWAETCMQIANIAKRKITSMQEETHRHISVMEAHQALVQGFQKASHAKFEPDELTPYEANLAEKLRKEKYATNVWNSRGKE